MATGMFGPAVEDIEATISAENWKKRYQGGALEDDIGNLFQSGFGLAAKALGAEDPRVSKAKKMKEAAAEAQANAKPGDTKDLYLQLSKSFEKHGFPEEALKAATAYRTMTREDKVDARAETQLGLEKQRVGFEGKRLDLAVGQDARQQQLHDRTVSLWEQDDKMREINLAKANAELSDLQAQIAARGKDYYKKQADHEDLKRQEELKKWIRDANVHEANVKLIRAQTGLAGAQAEKALRELKERWDFKYFTDPLDGKFLGAIAVEKNPEKGKMPKHQMYGPRMELLKSGEGDPGNGPFGGPAPAKPSDSLAQEIARRKQLAGDAAQNDADTAPPPPNTDPEATRYQAAIKTIRAKQREWAQSPGDKGKRKVQELEVQVRRLIEQARSKGIVVE